MPPPVMARRMDSAGPGEPWTKNPPAAVKFPGWKWVVIRIAMVAIGMATFQTVMIEFARDSQRIPSRFTVTMRSIMTMATRTPLGLNVPVDGW